MIFLKLDIVSSVYCHVISACKLHKFQIHYQSYDPLKSQALAESQFSSNFTCLWVAHWEGPVSDVKNLISLVI